MSYAEILGENAVKVKKSIAVAGTDQKNSALSNIAEALVSHSEEIIAANAADMENAEKNNMPLPMRDRLMLDKKRINDIADGVREVIELPDPVGIIESGSLRPNGLRITKVRVPIGVIGMIYESRPNVTADAAALCTKTGNAVILRGGKEAYNTNKIICDIMREAVYNAGFPRDIIQFVDDTTRETVAGLMKCDRYLDLLIPRGGAGLINSVTQNATVPVIKTGTGNCHIFVDESADIDTAVKVTDNAKTQRPSVCNAAESLLVHKNIAREFLPAVKVKLDEHNVELRGDAETISILGDCVVPVTEDDYASEFGDYIMSVRVVDSIDQAIEHIAKYSTGHSECIMTNDLRNAEKFKREVDSACVYVNASTRFTDGNMFGFGAEIGISTQKLHARGPMGLFELTTNKYLIDGSGQIRE